MQADRLTLAVTVATRAISAKSTLPILSNVLLQADGANLFVSATDLTLGLQVTIPADLAPLSTTAPARLLAEILAECKRHIVTLTAADCTGKDPDSLTVAYESEPVTVKDRTYRQRGRTTIYTLPADEFPILPFPQVKPSASLTVTAGSLADGLARCIPCAADDPSRARLESVHFVATDGAVTLESTDTHRAMQVVLPADGAIDVLGAADFLLPLRAAKEIARLLADEKGDLPVTIDVHLAAEDNDRAVVTLPLSWGTVRILTRLVEGTFPDFGKVYAGALEIPAVAVDAEDWAHGLSFAALGDKERAKGSYGSWGTYREASAGACIDLAAEDATLRLSAESAVALARTAVDVDGEENRASGSFSARLLRGIGRVDGQLVARIDPDGCKPALITTADGRVRLLVMPVVDDRLSKRKGSLSAERSFMAQQRELARQAAEKAAAEEERKRLGLAAVDAEIAQEAQAVAA